jgi:hypothetical protein
LWDVVELLAPDFFAAVRLHAKELAVPAEHVDLAVGDGGGGPGAVAEVVAIGALDGGFPNDLAAARVQAVEHLLAVGRTAGVKFAARHRERTERGTDLVVPQQRDRFIPRLAKSGIGTDPVMVGSAKSRPILREREVGDEQRKGQHQG